MRTIALLIVSLGFFQILARDSLRADEKYGMPDLRQVDQTCFPTATANLILWFGHHGYPKLIASGGTADDRELHTIHRIMDETHARFDIGTRMDLVVSGLQHYIQSAGYDGEVEYRGLDSEGPPFNREWLRENNDVNRGFILLFAYGKYDAQKRAFTPIMNTGHAVTLVNAEPGMLLVHDPAHDEIRTGRKILTSVALDGASFVDPGGTRSIAGLLMVSGSLLEAPQGSQVLMIGAVGVRLHPASEKKKSPAAAASTPKPADSGWWTWLTGHLF